MSGSHFPESLYLKNKILDQSLVLFCCFFFIQNTLLQGDKMGHSLVNIITPDEKSEVLHERNSRTDSDHRFCDKQITRRSRDKLPFEQRKII